MTASSPKLTLQLHDTVAKAEPHDHPVVLQVVHGVTAGLAPLQLGGTTDRPSTS